MPVSAKILILSQSDQQIKPVLEALLPEAIRLPNPGQASSGREFRVGHMEIEPVIYSDYQALSRNTLTRRYYIDTDAIIICINPASNCLFFIQEKLDQLKRDLQPPLMRQEEEICTAKIFILPILESNHFSISNLSSLVSNWQSRVNQAGFEHVRPLTIEKLDPINSGDSSGIQARFLSVLGKCELANGPGQAASSILTPFQTYQRRVSWSQIRDFFKSPTFHK
ncbi:MAG: hypothetical protein K0Q57_215 [Gammaproteobacteria bacterium]|jgi:hypothetical protein|nr:hypothetical protein [Gammaproteobacteria bacterium]